MSGSECFIMVGPLGAGKTTYAKAFADDAGLVYLCPDDLWDRFQVSRYSDELSISIWGQMYDRIYQCIKRQKNFILDSAQSNRRSRREVTGVIKSMSHGQYRITAIHLRCSLELCLMGVKNRNDLVPQEKVCEYYETLQKEPPILADGYDRIIPVSRDENDL